MSSKPPDRQAWLDEVCAGFVNPSHSNRSIYRVLLEALWPPGATLPGPVLGSDDLRAAVDAFRAANGKKPYKDVFRRLRELQGEEGLLGIEKLPRTSKYQLRDWKIAPKRLPRQGRSTDLLEEVAARSDGLCAVCHSDGEGRELALDHRVPRLRGGGDEAANFQLLCVPCNIFKSVTCRGCLEDCLTCPWCDPVSFPRITIRGDLLAGVVQAAVLEGLPPQAVVDQVLERFLEGEQIG